MLSHADLQPRIPPGFCCVGSTPVRAAELFARGESQAAVARALGVTTAAANHWYQAWQAKGRKG